MKKSELQRMIREEYVRQIISEVKFTTKQEQDSMSVTKIMREDLKVIQQYVHWLAQDDIIDTAGIEKKLSILVNGLEKKVQALKKITKV